MGPYFTFREGHDDAYDVSRQSVFFNYILYFVGQIWSMSHRIICSQAQDGLSTTACPPISLSVVKKETSLSQHLGKQGFNICQKSTIVWKTSWGSHVETYDNPTISK